MSPVCDGCIKLDSINSKRLQRRFVIRYFRMTKSLYNFDEVPSLKEQLGSFESLCEVIGAKTANLNEVKSLGVATASGIILSSAAYKEFIDAGSVDIPEELWEDFLQELKPIEASLGLKYGSAQTPLLLSVRGDASKYMLGMLDTVTHIGLNDITARALERTSGNRAYVWDCYRRLVQEYAMVVLHIPADEFEHELSQFRKARRLETWTKFSEHDFIELTKINKAIIVRKTGRAFPQDPFEQLRKVMCAAFASVTSERAKTYRKLLNIGDVTGSLTVSPMVFGNNGIGSMAIVSLSRDLVTGEAKVNGGYAVNATCTDVAFGERDVLGFDTFAKEISMLHREITEITKKAEAHFKYPVLLDFVVNEGKPVCLKAVRAQLTAPGRFKFAKDMVADNLFTQIEGLKTIEPDDMIQMMSAQLADESKEKFCKGVGAGKECIVGTLCLTPEDVFAAQKAGQHAVYVKNLLMPTDFDAFLAASAVVTAKGGNVGFGAGIARLFRKTGAFGCDGLEIDYESKCIRCRDVTINAGDAITVCGCGGVFAGEQERKNPIQLDDVNAKEVLHWADEIRNNKIFVYTNAHTASDVKLAVDVESDGVGLFTIEKFFDDEKQILIDLAKGYTEDALSAFEKVLTEKLSEVLSNGGSKAVTLRLFEAAFEKYLPCPSTLAKEIGEMTVKEAAPEEIEEKRNLLNMLKNLRMNSRVGCRSVRACVTHPEFMKTQFRAILSALQSAKSNAEPQLRILVPFVTEANEMAYIIKSFNEMASEAGVTAKIGAQIETPRACLTSAKVANACDFIDISTAFLNELTYGMIDEDCHDKFLRQYDERKIMNNDALRELDEDATAPMMLKCVSEARAAREDGIVGIYDDGFADPLVFKRFIGYGINSFICKPEAVPIVRLCAAQTVLPEN